MRNKINAICIVIALLAFVFQVEAQKLSKDERKVVASVDQQMPEAIKFLEEIININSGTNNLAGVKEVGMAFKEELDAMGFESKWIEMPKEVKRAGHLQSERKGQKGRNYCCLVILTPCLSPKAMRSDLSEKTVSPLVRVPAI